MSKSERTTIGDMPIAGTNPEKPVAVVDVAPEVHVPLLNELFAAFYALLGVQTPVDPHLKGVLVPGALEPAIEGLPEAIDLFTEVVGMAATIVQGHFVGLRCGDDIDLTRELLAHLHDTPSGVRRTLVAELEGASRSYHREGHKKVAIAVARHAVDRYMAHRTINPGQLPLARGLARLTDDVIATELARLKPGRAARGPASMNTATVAGTLVALANSPDVRHDRDLKKRQLHAADLMRKALDFRGRRAVSK